MQAKPATRFLQILVGLLLIFLDLRLNGFDVLPDFVGYALVALGCGGLGDCSHSFLTAQKLSWILAVVDVAGYFVPRHLLLAAIILALNCSLIWFLCGGIIELATRRNRADISQRAMGVRIVYVFLTTLTFLMAILLEGSRDAAPLVIVLVITGMIVMFFLVLLIYRVMQELAAEGR
jgi:hypothetical protein